MKYSPTAPMKNGKLARWVPPIPWASDLPLVAVRITAISSETPNSTVRTGWIRWIQRYPKMASSSAGMVTMMIQTGMLTDPVRSFSDWAWTTCWAAR